MSAFNSSLLRSLNGKVFPSEMSTGDSRRPQRGGPGKASSNRSIGCTADVHQLERGRVQILHVSKAAAGCVHCALDVQNVGPATCLRDDQGQSRLGFPDA